MKLKKLLTFLAVTGLMTAFLTGCTTDSKTTTNQKPTGTITLYTSQPEKDAQTLVESFNKKYPDVKVQIFRSGTEEIISKIMAEKKIGTIQADVLLVADDVTFESLKKQNLLLSYNSPEFKDIPEQFIDKDKKLLLLKEYMINMH